eukprot:Nitzschia sp. Nitz4//scaffold290_size23356//13888//16148//NITZ4_008491-RA/size23356-augustus-gene-0.35-mRNA-1//-1//CDS//3329546102//9434//frame0
MTVLVVNFSSVGNNPLNPLGLELRRLIWKSLEKAEQDPEIDSVILYGGGSNFSAGADLTEFGKLQALMNSGEEVFLLTEVINKIEAFPKPVLAAVSGNALGGGLEVALSCHYRISDAKGKFGLPEVHVGVIPGAGGTQRLPRLVGVAKALDMIVTGKPVKASEALKLGLVDFVAESHENLLETAQKWAQQAAQKPLDGRRVGSLPLKESPQDLEAIFETASKRLPKVEMGGEGVRAALEAVKACQLPIEEGMEVEGEQFYLTLTGSQGNARRHAFFAVRAAQKPLGNPPSGHPLLSKSFHGKAAAVVGAGLMGSGIAMVLLRAGFNVHLVDVYQASLKKGVAFLKNTIQTDTKKGKISKAKAEQMMTSLVPTQRMEDLSSCLIVVEAVIESMKIKKSIFEQLDKITPSGCILLSNTSTLDIDEMASAIGPSRRPQFAGWHFFSPAHVMKLVEIVTGKNTSLETTCILQQLTKRIGKTGVVVGNCDGFVGNRMLISYGAESALLLEEGAATVLAVDKALLKFGMAMGPLQMGDLAGLDIGYNVRKQRGWIDENGNPTSKTPARYPRIGDDIVSKFDRLGQKNGKGWYDYDKAVGKGRKPIPSHEVAELVKQYVAKPSQPFSEKEIQERILFPLVNEGFKVLEEDIANQPSDIDVIYLYGYGWPVYRGGPMYWADHEVGLPYLLGRLEEFSRQFPTTDYFKPSKLLETCVKSSLTVEKYYKLGLHKKVSSKL